MVRIFTCWTIVNNLGLFMNELIDAGKKGEIVSSRASEVYLVGTETIGQFKADDSPAGYMLLPCSVQLASLINRYYPFPKTNGKATATVGQFTADDSPAGSMLFPCSYCTLGSLTGLREHQKKQRQGDNVFAVYSQIDGKATATVGQFKADDYPAGSMLLPCSVQLGRPKKTQKQYGKAIKCFARKTYTEGKADNYGQKWPASDPKSKRPASDPKSKRSYCNLGSLAGLKEHQKKQRQGDNVFAVYPQIVGKATTTVGQFKADDYPAGSMLLPCSVQLGKLGKL
ncbi:hypothetical protein F2Q69_00021817 [Brassica cretica]|uniref:Uncharacterized protein n=1 Tax=Brassica cretica TaxID=69181 RepID=A0A8S9QGV6_BRACR|nr:hypothetical protein F2Q69_00021817 [Brassica cretica]